MLSELEGVVETLEQRTPEFPTKALEEFALKIDRIMGASRTIGMMDPDHAGLKRIGAIAELCKRLGYKAAEIKNPAFIPLFAGFWADTLEVLDELLDCLEDEAATKKVSQAFSSVVEKRLQWLSQKLLNTSTQSAKGTDQLGVDELLKSIQ